MFCSDLNIYTNQMMLLRWREDQANAANSPPQVLEPSKHVCPTAFDPHVPQLTDVYQDADGNHLAIARDMGWGNPFWGEVRARALANTLDSLGYSNYWVFILPSSKETELSESLDSLKETRPDYFINRYTCDDIVSSMFFVTAPHSIVGWRQILSKLPHDATFSSGSIWKHLNSSTFSFWHPSDPAPIYVPPHTMFSLKAFRIYNLLYGRTPKVFFQNEDLPPKGDEHWPAMILTTDPLLKELAVAPNEWQRLLKTAFSSDHSVSARYIEEIVGYISSSVQEVESWHKLKTCLGTPKDVLKQFEHTRLYYAKDFGTYAISVKMPDSDSTGTLTTLEIPEVAGNHCLPLVNKNNSACFCRIQAMASSEITKENS